MMRKEANLFNKLSIVFGFSFLYVPVLLMIIMSFNQSKLVTVWGGWSTRWYVALLHDRAMLDAASITIRLGVLSASIATILGTMAAFGLVRLQRSFSRDALASMIYAPIIVPEVITGLSLLLFFVALNLDRGFWTLTLAHITFSMCYVTIIVQSRILEFDQSVEQAANDLGCPPVKTFLLITLPLIAPAIIAGWVLAFTLSIDDLVISAFTSGPSSTTLPLRIYSSVKLGISPEVNAVCSTLMLLVSFGVILVSLAQKRKDGLLG